jgi:hypothetical protein
MVSLLLPLFLGALIDASGPTDRSPSISPAHHAVLLAPDRRVRAPQPRTHEFIVEGFRRSRTFANLMFALNRTDVIVYVETAFGLGSDTMGRLLMLPLAGNQRYLRIQIRETLSRDDAIAVIAHELRHALEVAEAPEVRDQASLIKLYQRIGYESAGWHSFDTDAAQTTGRRVKSELAS